MQEQHGEEQCVTALVPVAKPVAHDDDSDEVAECPICFDELGNSKTLECPNGHCFCRNCLRRMYAQSGSVLTCPLCRTIIDSSCLKLRSMRAPKGGAVVTLRIGNTHSELGSPAADGQSCAEGADDG